MYNQKPQDSVSQASSECHPTKSSYNSMRLKYLIVDRELWTSELSFHAKQNREDSLWTHSINYSDFHVRTVRDHGGPCLPRILAKTPIVWISDFEMESWTLNRKEKEGPEVTYLSLLFSDNFMKLRRTQRVGNIDGEPEVIFLPPKVVMIPNSRTTPVGSNLSVPIASSIMLGKLLNVSVLQSCLL